MYNSENPDSITSTSGLLTKMYLKVHKMADINSTSKSFYVYVHRRATDGRVFYVGKGSGSRSHSSHQRSKYWKNIVAKHGYITEIVQNNILEWWSLELECELIAFYGRDSLCNHTDGGEGISGYSHTQAAKDKIKKSNIGKIVSDSTRMKLSENNPMKNPVTAKKAGRKGRVMSEEWLEKLRLSKIGTKRSEETKQKMRDNNKMKDPEVAKKVSDALKNKPKKTSRSIICVETNQLFKTVSEAASVIRLVKKTASTTNIWQCLQRERKFAYGFHWKYA